MCRLHAAFEHAVPVHEGKQVAFEDPHAPAFTGLIDREGLIGLFAIIEFGKDQSADSGDEWAGGIAVVLRSKRLVLDGGEEVFHDDRSLFANRGSRFRGGEITAVTQTEDIAEVHVTKRLGIDVDPAGGIGQGTGCDEVRRAHRRRDMQEVVVDRDFLLGVEIPEVGGASFGLDADEFVFEAALDLFAGNDFFERGTIGLNGEDIGLGGRENDLGFLSNLGFAKTIVGEVHDLLRGTSAFHGARRVREQRGTTLEVTNGFPGRVDCFEGVIAADSIVPHGLLQSGDRTPANGKSGSDNKVRVGDGFSITSPDLIESGLEFGDGVTNPGGAFGNHGGERSFGHGFANQSGSGESPEGLVIVFVGGIDNGDIEMGLFPQQLCGDGDSRCAAADDQDLVMLGLVHRESSLVCGNGSGGPRGNLIVIISESVELSNCFCRMRLAGATNGGGLGGSGGLGGGECEREREGLVEVRSR